MTLLSPAAESPWEYPYWVQIRGVKGHIEFDSSLARATRAIDGTLDVECVVSAGSGAEAIERARHRYANLTSGSVETVLRLTELVLPRVTSLLLDVERCWFNEGGPHGKQVQK